MIRENSGMFELHTSNTTYAFRIMETGHLEHLYYGRRMKMYHDSHEIGTESHKTDNILAKMPAYAPAASCAYDDLHRNLCLDDVCLEMSSNGKSDMREPFIEVLHADGSRTSDFLFEKYEITSGKEEFVTLPGSYDDSGKVEQLCITLCDKQYNLTLEIYYYVFEACDVITRSAKLWNHGKDEVKLLRLMSMQLDFNTCDYVLTHFTGSWGREMKKNTHILSSGKFVNASFTGTSSNKANPFIMLGGVHTTEDAGECYGFNLIYSGNHYEALEVSSYGKTRLVSGINPQSFCYLLGAGECFEAPEAVMTFSHHGFNGISSHMHAFVQEHIIRGEWKKKERPVLLNSWEASYFDINEDKLLKLAKAGKDAGVELFVMDDGWFGKRNDDTSSLGDWEYNPQKLPNGLRGLCDKIKALGLNFGIWVEPEMVSVNSKLYQKHPEWTLEIPGKPHSEGRNQRILDLTNPKVQDYIIESMSNVFSSCDISYIKWDMNRNFSDYFSQYLPADRQGETAHRYVLGLYRCMKELTKRFPKILFEGCSSGGNRFDLGILSYFPQIWASDNTDAVCRAEIQNGYSYGYPLSTISAHVSACPNHQTFRSVPLETRFSVAAFGVFGYECNFCDMSVEEFTLIKEQIALYKKWRPVLQFGSFYRGRSFCDAQSDIFSTLKNNSGNVMEWTCVAEDKSRAVGMLYQTLVIPNVSYEYYRAKGLHSDYVYHFYNESENSVAYGDALMHAGVKLTHAFAMNDYHGTERQFHDFSSRLFFMEKYQSNENRNMLK
ncbi:MAG: alpha-galactosidase [Lachnospiraceae bacterium]|nr:alpha-galactosidase [Lachnospiraceae bacterium]